MLRILWKIVLRGKLHYEYTMVIKHPPKLVGGNQWGVCVHNTLERCRIINQLNSLNSLGTSSWKLWAQPGAADYRHGKRIILACNGKKPFCALICCSNFAVCRCMQWQEVWTNHSTNFGTTHLLLTLGASKCLDSPTTDDSQHSKKQYTTVFSLASYNDGTFIFLSICKIVVCKTYPTPWKRTFGIWPPDFDRFLQGNDHFSQSNSREGYFWWRAKKERLLELFYYLPTDVLALCVLCAEWFLIHVTFARKSESKCRHTRNKVPPSSWGFYSWIRMGIWSWSGPLWTASFI